MCAEITDLRAQLAEVGRARDALLETLGRDGEYLRREPTEDEKRIENAEYRGKSVWAWWAKAHAYGHMVHGVNPILGAKDGEHTNDAAKRVVAERDALRGQLAEAQEKLTEANYWRRNYADAVKLTEKERDAAQARVGELEGLLREARRWLGEHPRREGLTDRIDAALAGGT